MNGNISGPRCGLCFRYDAGLSLWDGKTVIVPVEVWRKNKLCKINPPTVNVVLGARVPVAA